MGLRWYQQEAVQSVHDYYAAGNKGNCVIALPTGTGKSHVIGSLQGEAIRRWPNQRFLNATHSKVLVEQNAEKFHEAYPEIPYGINSSGLNRREIAQQVIFGGIMSMKGNPEAFGHRDLLVVDECHLISTDKETVYRKTIDRLIEVNPKLKVVGLTATAYRMGQGMITDGGIFDDIVYDLTDIEGFAKLLSQGYLAPLYTRPTDTELDISGVGVSKGEFKKGALQSAVNSSPVTIKAIQEMCQKGWDRKAWLIFASGVEHAEDIARILNNFGVPTAAVHSKLSTEENNRRVAAFKRGELRCITNNEVLTTGFDFPPIDYIGMFRPTMSPGLWVQMLGRGTRPWAGGYIKVNGIMIPWGPKTDCIVLDFAGNAKRLGPINDPCIPKRKVPGDGDMPIKVCPSCTTQNHLSATHCICCGHEFERMEKLSPTAFDGEIMRDDKPVVEYFDVTSVIYRKQFKKGSNDKVAMLAVDYYCGVRRFSDLILVEHKGLAGHQARDWWRTVHNSPPPETVDEALQYQSQLRSPKRVRVWVNRQWPKVLSCEY